MSFSLRIPGAETRGRWGCPDTEVTRFDLPNEELSDLITDGLLRVAEGGTSGVTFSDYVSPSTAAVPLQSTDKEGVIRELVACLDRAGRVTNAKQVLLDVMEREATVSTGMAKGLAIPHGRTSGVNGMAVAVGVSPEGVDFQSLDGQTTHLVFLIAGSPEDRGPHLQLLAALAKQMRDEDRIAAAIAAKDEVALVEAILGT